LAAPKLNNNICRKLDEQTIIDVSEPQTYKKQRQTEM